MPLTVLHARAPLARGLHKADTRAQWHVVAPLDTQAHLRIMRAQAYDADTDVVTGHFTKWKPGDSVAEVIRATLFISYDNGDSWEKLAHVGTGPQILRYPPTGPDDDSLRPVRRYTTLTTQLKPEQNNVRRLVRYELDVRDSLETQVELSTRRRGPMRTLRPSHNSVAFEDSSSAAAEGATSVSSGSVTPATGDYWSVAWGYVAATDAAALSSFNINETGATEISGTNVSYNASGLAGEVWCYEAAGISSAHDADFTVDTSVNDIFCALMTLSGVDQDTPYENATATGAAFFPDDSLGTSVSSATDDRVVDFTGNTGFSAITFGGGDDTANIVETTYSGESGIQAGHEDGAATVTVGYAEPGTSGFCYVAMNVVQSAGGGGGGPDTPQGLHWINRGLGPQRSSSLGGELH